MRGRLGFVLATVALLAGASHASAGALALDAREDGPDLAVVRVDIDWAIRRALSVAPRLKRSGALEEAAVARVRSAHVEGLPSLAAEAGYTRSSDVPELTLALPGAPPRTIFPNLPDAWRSRLEVSVPVLTGGRLESSKRVAEEERSAAALDRTAVRLDLVLETTAAYWTLVSARKSAHVLEEALVAYDGHIKAASDREQLGMVARSDVLAVRVERERAELASIEARSSAAVAEADLARLLDLPPEARLEAVSPLEGRTEDAPLAPLRALLERALAQRPERDAIARRADAAASRIETFRALGRPQAEAAVGYDLARPNRKILPPEPAWKGTWDAGVSVRLAVLDGGRTASAVAGATALAAAARFEVDELERSIRQEVAARRLDVVSAQAALPVAARGVEAAEEALRVIRDRYGAGVATSAELLDAESALLRAGLDRTRALALERIARARLDRAIGEPSSPDPAKVSRGQPSTESWRDPAGRCLATGPR